MVETSTAICIHSPGAGQRPALLAQLVQRLMGPVPLAEAVGKRLTLLLKDRRHDHHHRPLDTLVRAAGFASRPLLPIVLLAPHPLDGWRHRPIVAPPLMQVPQGGLQVLGRLRGRYLIHPRRAALTGLTLGCPQDVTGNQVTHVVAHHRRRALWPAAQFSGVSWIRLGARRLSQRSCQKTVMPGFPFPPVGPWDTVPRRPGPDRAPALGTRREDGPWPVSGAFGSRSSPDTVPRLLLRVPVFRTGACERLERPLHARSLVLSGRHSPTGCSTRTPVALPRFQVPPVTPGTGLRPRWCPGHSP